MPSRETRIARLQLAHARRPDPPPAPTGFDPSRLSMKEQCELDRLLAPLAPLPGERCNLGPLTDEQLDRSADLMNKAHGIPPSPPYFGMPHRDPGIGACLCRDCARQPTPTDDDRRPDPAA